MARKLVGGPAQARPSQVPDNPPIGTFWQEGGTIHPDVDTETKYLISGTTYLGPHPAGKIVSAADLGPGAQIQRLLDQGLLSPIGPDGEVKLVAKPKPLPPPVSGTPEKPDAIPRPPLDGPPPVMPSPAELDLAGIEADPEV
jgi:hypothetical protein